MRQCVCERERDELLLGTERDELLLGTDWKRVGRLAKQITLCGRPIAET